MDAQHLSISFLWQYTRHMNPAIIKPPEHDHLAMCDRCVAIMWVCQVSSSIEEAKKKILVSYPDAE